MITQLFKEGLKNISGIRSTSRVWVIIGRSTSIVGTAADVTLPTYKEIFHPDSPFSVKYDMNDLCRVSSDLNKFVSMHAVTKERRINFGDPAAVRALNEALLSRYYNDHEWNLPDGLLCPPVPSRAEYLYYMRSELLNYRSGIRVLDIGCGASCIYPVIATGIDPTWEVVGTETNVTAMHVAERIARNRKQISVRHQPNSNHIFRGVVEPKEKFDVSVCKPPQCGSEKEAVAQLKRRSRFRTKTGDKVMDAMNEKALLDSCFELWSEGGERAFLVRMIRESARQEFRHTVGWFTTLVSVRKNMPYLRKVLSAQRPSSTKVITMKSGDKESRILCWSFRFHSTDER